MKVISLKSTDSSTSVLSKLRISSNLFNPLASKKIKNERVEKNRRKSRQQEQQLQQQSVMNRVESILKENGSRKSIESRKESLKSRRRQCLEEEEDHDSKIKLQLSDSISSLVEMRNIMGNEFGKRSKAMKTADLEDSFRTIDSLISTMKTTQQKHFDDKNNTKDTGSIIESISSISNNNDQREKGVGRKNKAQRNSEFNNSIPPRQKRRDEKKDEKNTEENDKNKKRNDRKGKRQYDKRGSSCTPRNNVSEGKGINNSIKNKDDNRNNSKRAANLSHHTTKQNHFPPEDSIISHRRNNMNGSFVNNEIEEGGKKKSKNRRHYDGSRFSSRSQSIACNDNQDGSSHSTIDGILYRQGSPLIPDLGGSHADDASHFKKKERIERAYSIIGQYHGSSNSDHRIEYFRRRKLVSYKNTARQSKSFSGGIRMPDLYQQPDSRRLNDSSKENYNNVFSSSHSDKNKREKIESAYSVFRQYHPFNNDSDRQFGAVKCASKIDYSQLRQPSRNGVR